MYTIGAAPAMFQRLTRAVATRPGAIAPKLMPRALAVTVPFRPVPLPVVARAAQAARVPSEMPRLRSLVARAAAIPRRIGPTEARSIAPTAPTITPKIAPRPGTLLARVMAKAPPPARPKPKPLLERVRAKALARVAARPPGSTVPVPVSPFEAQALLPAPAPRPKALPPGSPFALRPGPPIEAEIFPDEQLPEGPGELYEREAEPLEELLPEGAAVPDWIEDTLPGVPAATESVAPIGPLDPLDELDLYNELGQPNLSELELERIRSEARMPAAAPTLKPTDVLLGVGALLALAWIFRGGAPPRGRFGGGKARF